MTKYSRVFPVANDVEFDLRQWDTLDRWIYELKTNYGTLVNVKDYGAAGDGATNDTAAINAAIAALTTNGRLYFPAGRYQTDGGHTISVPCTIVGDGHGTIGTGNGVSVLSLRNAANSDLLTLAAKAITIRGLGLYGNLGNQSGTSRGIVLSAVTVCNYFVLRDLWIDSFHDDGISVNTPGASLQGVIDSVTSNLNNGHGVAFNTGAADITVSDTVLSKNGLSGGWINAADIVFDTVHSWGNGTLSTASDCDGVMMPSGAPGQCRFVNGYYESNGTVSVAGRGIKPRGRGNVVVGNHVYNNTGQGIFAFSCTNDVYNDNVVFNNARNGGAAFNGAGIALDTCTAVATVGNNCYDNGGTKKQTYGYAENANTCNACLLNGNVIRAADHLTGSSLIGTGNPTATTNAANVG